jgi:branched-subunit amino acid transport protein
VTTHQASAREHLLGALAAACAVLFLMLGAAFFAMPLHQAWLGYAVLASFCALIVANVFVAREVKQRRARAGYK